MSTTITDTRWKPSPEQRELLTQLLEHANREESHAAFCRRYWTGNSPSMFTQIVGVLDPPRTNEKGELVLSYFDRISEERRTELFDQITALLEEIPRQRAINSRIKELRIFRTSKLRAVETAVRECADLPGAERLIVCLAPTGGGKTMIANHLAEKFNARFVEVRDVWRNSNTGFVPLMDICRSVVIRIKTRTASNIDRIQDALMRYCEDRRIVLCFDEGEHFGRSALNLLKLLLNRTRIVPVIFCITDEYDRWDDYWPNEAAQIARRTHSIIELSTISAADAGLFFPEKQFAQPEVELDFLSREASHFGHFSLLARVGRKLDGVSKADHAEVQNAVNAARRQMLREGRLPKK